MESNYQAMIAAIAISKPKSRYDDRCSFYDRKGEIINHNIDRAYGRLMARPISDPTAISALASWYR